MPLYAYECKECGVRFDRRQGFDEAPVTICPECEGDVHRLIQPVGIVFKGSGFYSTDHKSSRSSALSSGGKKSDNASEESSSKTESKAESKTESKVESKTESKAESSATPSTPSAN